MQKYSNKTHLEDFKDIFPILLALIDCFIHLRLDPDGKHEKLGIADIGGGSNGHRTGISIQLGF